MPLPIATHQQRGEVHSKAKVWAAQANRYRELARAREEHRQYYGDVLAAAIAANPLGKGVRFGPAGNRRSPLGEPPRRKSGRGVGPRLRPSQTKKIGG